MFSYKLLNCIFEPSKEEETLAFMLNYVKKEIKNSNKLLITLFSQSNFFPTKDYFSYNLINVDDFKMASLLEHKIQELRFDCQLIDGSRLFPLSQKSKTKRLQLSQLSFKKKLKDKDINIIVFNKIDSIHSPQFLFRKSTLPLRLGKLLKIKSCEMLLPKGFYENNLNSVHQIEKTKNSSYVEMSYSELIDILTYCNNPYFSPDFIRDSKNKNIMLFLFAHGENTPRYQIKANKEISGELVHWIKTTTDVSRFVLLWLDKSIFHKSLAHFFHLLGNAGINSFGTQSSATGNNMFILSMFIEKKNFGEMNTLLEYNKKVLGYESVSCENLIGVIDIIGQKFHSSSRVVAQIATIMSNRPYPFHITDLNSNHIRLCLDINSIKEVAQLLTNELIC